MIDFISFHFLGIDLYAILIKYSSTPFYYYYYYYYILLVISLFSLLFSSDGLLGEYKPQLVIPILERIVIHSYERLIVQVHFFSRPI
jgi:hypothetical protein